MRCQRNSRAASVIRKGERQSSQRRRPTWGAIEPMLNAQTWKNWAPACVAVALIVWIVGTSQSLQSCMHELKNDKSFQALHESGPAIGRIPARLRLNVACVGHFIEVNDAAITALATLIVALFTATLWGSTRQQAYLTRKSIDLALREFVSTNRPRLRVRRFRLYPLVHGQPITLQYELVNVGATKARILRSEINVTLTLPTQQPILAAREIGMAREIAGGEALLVNPTMNLDYDDSWRKYLLGGGNWLSISGFIQYFDDNGTPRRTGFARVYDSTNNSFARFEATDPDYEYED
jgi:hypothetical protein